jgi:protein-S-isoprenylcysteine O-methyltransferase Ste14
MVMDWSGFCAGIARFGPAIFFTFVAAFYTARILWLGRRQGASPVAYGVPGTPPHRIYRTFRVFRLLIWMMSVGRAIWPPFGLLALPIPMLTIPALMTGGNLLMAAAFARVAWLNLSMGDHWRSGAPRPDDPGPLFTDGAFARCRHPMLAAVMVGQVGLFLAIPSLFTLICLLVGLWTLVEQVAVEERELASRHGERWAAYCAVTPKWPWSRHPVTRSNCVQA